MSFVSLMHMLHQKQPICPEGSSLISIYITMVPPETTDACVSVEWSHCRANVKTTKGLTTGAELITQ